MECQTSRFGTAAAAEMIRAIQTAYYQQAKNPSLPEALQACTREIGLDAEVFSKDLKSPAIEIELQQQMQRARSLDGYPYPSLRLVHNNAVFPVSLNYLNHRIMLETIQSVVA